MFFRKKKRPINVEKGKRIFFAEKGNGYGIWLDYGEEYYNCNIPKEMEEEWQKELEAVDKDTKLT